MSEVLAKRPKPVTVSATRRPPSKGTILELYAPHLGISSRCYYLATIPDWEDVEALRQAILDRVHAGGTLDDVLSMVAPYRARNRIITPPNRPAYAIEHVRLIQPSHKRSPWLIVTSERLRLQSRYIAAVLPEHAESAVQAVREALHAGADLKELRLIARRYQRPRKTDSPTPSLRNRPLKEWLAADPNWHAEARISHREVGWRLFVPAPYAMELYSSSLPATTDTDDLLAEVNEFLKTRPTQEELRARFPPQRVRQSNHAYIKKATVTGHWLVRVTSPYAVTVATRKNQAEALALAARLNELLPSNPTLADLRAVCRKTPVV